MTPVKSSNIEAVGYDASTKVLKVKFKVGGTHAYEGVSQAQYEGFITAPSIGKHFHAYIRNVFNSSPVA